MPVLFLSLLKAAGTAFFGRLLGATLTERVLADVFFKLAAWLASRTSNGMDDGLVEQIRTAYYNPTQE